LAGGLLLSGIGYGDEAHRTIYVNNCIGSDGYDGQAAEPSAGGRSGPVASISRALKLVPTGGRVSIANTRADYRERVAVDGLRKGRAAAPLVIEGNGAAVSGLVTVAPQRWIHFRDDLYYFENLIGGQPPVYGPMPSSNWLFHWKHQGWFQERQAPEIFRLNGRPAPHVRELAAIPAGGFFYDTQANPRRLYFRLPAGRSLQACVIDLPLNEGVFVNDDYVVVRNLASKYSQDDGFAGFWGVGVVFENCNGSYNCDQGISLHGTSQTLIDGGLYERNGGCGIADVMSCITVYRNVTIRDNMVAGAWFAGLAHSLLGCRLSGNYGPQITAQDDTALGMTDCLVVGSPHDGSTIGVSMWSGRINHCTIVNFPVCVQIGRSGQVSNSVLAGASDALLRVDAKAADSFRFWNNILALGTVIVGQRKGTKDNWRQFAAAVPEAGRNFPEDPKLQPPLFALPAGSPHFKAADYGATPGVRVSLPGEWKPVGEK
jgi:hypothetical protein